ncbi:MAG: hypothetical protein ACRD1X_03765 [Vicinamibacteria bacterium]
MRAISLLSLSIALLTVGCDDLLDRVSTKQPAPAPSSRSSVDTGRVSISGNTTGSEGESIRLTAQVANARGELEYEWSMNGRGSLMNRETDPQNAVVIASTTGRLEVTVTVTEDGDEIGSATVTLQITD